MVFCCANVCKQVVFVTNVQIIEAAATTITRRKQQALCCPATGRKDPEEKSAVHCGSFFFRQLVLQCSARVVVI